MYANRPKLFVFAIVVFAILLAACQPVATEPMMADSGSMLPLEKVRFGLPGALTHFDPALPGETSEGSTIKLISGQLLRLDQYGVPQPDLAESMDVSEDGLVYTFTLRENLMYSDGTPVTVGDIVYTWERIKDAPPTDKGPIANVVSVEATDDRTVVWTLSIAEPSLPFWFGRTGFSVHPEAQVEADPDGYFRSPVSAGPYYVAAGEPGDPVVTLKENPNYQLGPMAVKELELHWVPDPTSRSLLLATGQLDYVYELPPQARDTFPPEVETFVVALGGVFHLSINQQISEDHCLSNRDVREAISLAIDRSEINERALLGISPPVIGYFYTGQPLDVGILPNGGAQDLEAAKALMANTPWADGGCSFTVTTYGPRPGYVEGILVFAEQLKELNMEVTPDGQEVGVALDIMANSPDYHAGWAVTGNNGGPPESYLRNQFLDGFWAQRSRIDDAEMKRLFDELGQTVDQGAREDLIRQIQYRGYEVQSIIPCCERSVMGGSRVGQNAVRTVTGASHFIVVPLADVEQ